MSNQAPISHVELRPIFDYSDHCVVSSLADAEYFGVYSACAGEPASRDQVFDTANDALQHMFGDKYQRARKWYNGNEIMHEITTTSDLLIALADHDDLDTLAQQFGLTSPKN